MEWWTIVRPRNEESTRLCADNAKELWYKAYREARIMAKLCDGKTVTFRLHHPVQKHTKRVYIKGEWVCKGLFGYRRKTQFNNPYFD